MLEEFSSTHYPSPKCTTPTTLLQVEIDRLQNIVARLHEQAEATQSTNDLIAKLFTMMSTLEAKDVPLFYASPVQEVVPHIKTTSTCT
jgi:hypothetical protein